MKQLKPDLSTTKIDPYSLEWLPASLNDLLNELEALKQTAEESNSLLLFRGHRQREWRLDSTFARTVKNKLFSMQAHEGYSIRLRDSGDLNLALTSLLLLKYGTIFEPSAELKRVETEHDVDSWFELMKRHQQHPTEDIPVLQGSNFLDWSRSSDVALYFANLNRNGAGAIFVCDASATGKTQQTLRVLDILRKVREQMMQGQANGAPLLFSPQNQILNQRAKNQQAVYFAQMELRLDLAELWRMTERTLNNETIVVKLIVPPGTEHELERYLVGKGTDRKFIFPDDLDK